MTSAYKHAFSYLKNIPQPWLVWLVGRPGNVKVAGSIPGWGTYLGCGPGSWLVYTMFSHISRQCFPPKISKIFKKRKHLNPIPPLQVSSLLFLPLGALFCLTVAFVSPIHHSQARS